MSIEEVTDITVVEGTTEEELPLNKQVLVSYKSGDTELKDVIWDLSSVNLSEHGTYSIQGILSNSTLSIEMNVKVIKEFPDQVTIDDRNAILKEGQTLQLTASITPTEVKDDGLTWSSSDGSIVEVSQDGLVTAISEGKANVTVTTINGKTSTVEIVVSNRPNLRLNAYGSVTINNVIKNIAINLSNTDSETLHIEKIEVYEEGNLGNFYTESQLQSAGLSTEVRSGTTWGMSISYKYGRVWKDKSFVRIYVRNLHGLYEFEDNL